MDGFSEIAPRRGKTRLHVGSLAPITGRLDADWTWAPFLDSGIVYYSRLSYHIHKVPTCIAWIGLGWGPCCVVYLVHVSCDVLAWLQCMVSDVECILSGAYLVGFSTGWADLSLLGECLEKIVLNLLDDYSMDSLVDSCKITQLYSAIIP